MDRAVLDLGRRIVECPRQSTCPGLRAGLVTNAINSGTPPRGLLIQPALASLDEVTVVVLGLNPGRADATERHELRAAAARDRAHLFEHVHAETLANMPRWKYWRRAHALLEALEGELVKQVVLAVELVFCECAPGERYPGRDTIAHCTATHLERIATLVPPDARWLCVGGAARDWLAHSKFADRPWAWVEHLTGAMGDPFGRMFALGAVRPEVKAAWVRAGAREERGACLSRQGDEQPAPCAAPNLAPGGSPEPSSTRDVANDEADFWAEVETMLARPVTIGGVSPSPKRYRKGTFATKVALAVIADTRGEMGVELWSVDRHRQNALRRIHDDVAAGRLACPAPLRLHPGPRNADCLYLDFEWRRTGAHRAELDHIRTLVHWFVGIRPRYL